MLPPVQTSFIPKQNLSAAVLSKARAGGLSFFLVLAFLVLALVAATGAGIFAYQYFLIQQIDRPCPAADENNPQSCGLRSALAWYRKELAPARLSRYQEIDAKFRAAEALFSRHQAFLPLLDLLGAQTLKAVQYKDFKYGQGAVTVKGLTGSYEDVAVQSKVFKQAIENKKGLTSFVVTDLAPDDKGLINFTLTLQFDPAVGDFGSFIKSLPVSTTTATSS